MIGETFSRGFAFGATPGTSQSGGLVSAYLYLPVISGQLEQTGEYKYATNPLNFAGGQSKTLDFVTNYADQPPTNYTGTPTITGYIGNNIIVVGADTAFPNPIVRSLQTSIDGGKTFESSYPNFWALGGKFLDGAYAFGYHWLVIGYALYKTTDFNTFTPVTLPTADFVFNIAIKGNTIVLGIKGGVTVSTDSGANWSYTALSGSGFGTTTENKAYTDGVAFILKNTSRQMRRSTDGITWSIVSFSSGSFDAIDAPSVAGNGIWLLGARRFLSINQGSTALSTDNGLTWTNTINPVDRFGNAFEITSLAFANGLFIAAADYGDVFTSTDGINWTGQVVKSGGFYRGQVMAFVPEV